jgi:UDP-N-acetylglucosamine acyltransferase
VAYGGLVVGDDNVFREHVTVHRGSVGDTRIGSRCLVMAGAHVAHDASIESDVVLANLVQLAGHVVVEDHVNFGGMAGVAQRVRIGNGAFVAAGSMVERDVPPFVIVQGDRARVRAINQVGLKRRNVPVGVRRAIQREFRRLYVAAEPGPEPDGDLDPMLRQFLEFHTARR